MSVKVSVFNSSSVKYLPKKKIRKTVEYVLAGEMIDRAEISLILVSDKEIHELNNRFLQHDYPTDVLSFQLGEHHIEGEIYISVNTAQRQAKEYKVSLTNELKRLAAHGTLHLAGYDDSTDNDKKIMRSLEDRYISI